MKQSTITYNKDNLTITIEGMDEVEKALEDLKRKTPAAAKVAINATAQEARKLMIAQAKARYAVNAKGAQHLKDLKTSGKKGHNATNTNLEAVLFIAKPRGGPGLLPAPAHAELFRAGCAAQRAGVRAGPHSEILVHAEAGGGGHRGAGALHRAGQQGLSGGVQQRPRGHGAAAAGVQLQPPGPRPRDGRAGPTAADRWRS